MGHVSTHVKDHAMTLVMTDVWVRAKHLVKVDVKEAASSGFLGRVHGFSMDTS